MGRGYGAARGGRAAHRRVRRCRVQDAPRERRRRAPPAETRMINLYSDTQTRPTEAMRAAMAGAEVGDEQRREDPTVLALQERVAELLGQEAAVFLPSGTMCNAIAVRLHIRPGGDEYFLGEMAHPLRFEAGGPAAISGAVLTVLPGASGIFTADALRGALGAHSPGDRYAPRPRLVSVEQPVNV